MNRRRPATPRMRFHKAALLHISAILALATFLVAPVMNQAAAATLGVVRLTPHSQTDTVGSQAQFVIWVINPQGVPLSGVSIHLTDSGANNISTNSTTTDSNGRAELSYTGLRSGTDTVVAHGSLQGQQLDSKSVTVVWNSASSPNFSLSPVNTSVDLNTSQTVTATVRDDSGNPLSGQTVRFSVTGANPSGPVNRVTNSSGVAAYSYTGTTAGTDTVTAFADTNHNNTQDPGEPGASTTISWLTYKLALSVSDSTASVGSNQSVTATVTDTNGDPAEGIAVHFTVSGVNPTSGVHTSGSNGQATFAYTGTHSGVDTIAVYADVDGSGTQNSGDPSGSTTITWGTSSLTLSPQDSSASTGTTQTITATVHGGSGQVLENVAVRFSVTGANPTSASRSTNLNGQASFSYTGNNTGKDTITAYADLNNNGSQDSGEPSASTSLNWVSSQLTLTLSLSNTTAQVGSNQTVTATVMNANNQPVSGMTVHFLVTGANPTTVNKLTDSNGHASFSYTGSHAGADSVHAYGDLNANGTQDDGDPIGNATLNWTSAPSIPASATAPAQPKAGCTYFPETQHNLCAGFAAYWNTFGDLSTYGFPLTEEFQQNGVTTQYFERARFEWHPGAWPARYDVLLGLLGDELTAGRADVAFQRAAVINSSDCIYFTVTGHNLCGAFRTYWEQFGGEAVYGMPISEPFQENGITVQYFERQRFELHPGVWSAHYDVLLGRVGAEILAKNGY